MGFEFVGFAVMVLLALVVVAYGLFGRRSLFAGILFFWFALLLFPLGIQFGQMGMVLYWIVGGAVALTVAVYSFRAAVKRQATEK